MRFNSQIAAQYVTALPLLEAWFCDPKNEKTNIGVNAAGIRGVAAGPAGSATAPLSSYNTWANAELVKLLRGFWDLSALQSVEGMGAFHAYLVESVESFWLSRGFPALARHQSYRLCDSFIKWMRVGAKSRPQIARAVHEFGHVVVNGPTLELLERLCDKLPSYSTQMAPQDTTASYHQIQAIVREFCHQYGGTPILFDVFARNEHHARASVSASRTAASGRSALMRGLRRQRAQVSALVVSP
ncbi:hypothetical protein [Caballeronia sp. SBC2]|uniref:hypothetical protein n=1 Tax=Caballeronia sp. SBC2 TaxID=2705547 RepID=UPI0013E1B85E|nr:hypothetical protein [Caballeronia sp. SBC2]QIE22960.1 hypothetical protein SBC2_09730 [Caballeronia sp. SBC2]